MLSDTVVEEVPREPACMAHLASSREGDEASASPGVERDQSDVSVVIVNYNAGPILRSAVDAALAQASEVIVVDSGSSDDSCLSLQDVQAFGTRLHLQNNARNVGFTVGCNAGARQAKGQYLLFLNPDCVLAPGAIDRMVEALGREPSAGMAGGLLCNEDGSEQPGGRRAVPTPWRSMVRAFGLSRFAARWPKLFEGYDLCAQPLPSGAAEVEAISGACMLVKREALDAVGPLDEGYFMHCEDLDWCMRFRAKGWKILFVPEARAVHRAGTCSKSRPLFVEWHKHKGMVRFYRKFFAHQYPGPLLYLVVAGVWLRFAAKALVISAKRLATGG